MRKKYNTPHRSHVVKTRLSDEEYADFTERLSAYEISQSEFIVINSLRIAEVPMLPHMDRPADRKAGCKHRCTDAAMNYLKAKVMEMCHEAGLYQIDLLHGRKERVTEREYRAQKRDRLRWIRRTKPEPPPGSP